MNKYLISVNDGSVRMANFYYASRVSVAIQRAVDAAKFDKLAVEKTLTIDCRLVEKNIKPKRG